MINQFKVLGLALLSCLILTAGLGRVHAATSSTVDILPDEVVRAPTTVDVGPVMPIAGQRPGKTYPSPSGNPLWSVPLSVLTATQERPIFSASRRPPPRAVIAPLQEQVSAPVVQKPAELERPPLALIGAVVGDSDAIAVFLDRTDQKIVRLRQGDTHAGWLLSSVLRREVTIRKADQVEVLALQRSDGSTGSPGTTAVFPPIPAAASPAGSYAPFVPRHTPKNGEADGL